MGAAVGQDCALLEEVCGWINAKATIPVWAKMTPNITDITQVRFSFCSSGLLCLSSNPCSSSFLCIPDCIYKINEKNYCLNTKLDTCIATSAM